MTPVTDPNLIDQLESAPGLTPVTDPALVAQLEGSPQQIPQGASNPGLPLRLTGDIASGLADAGQGVHNFLSSALTPILGKYAPAQTHVDFQRLFGVNDPNIGDKLLQGTAQYAPFAAAGGAGLLGQMLAGAGYGATQSAQPVQGTAIGAGLGALGEVAPALVGGLGKVSNLVRPQKYANQILGNLGNGNSLESNAQSLAQDIKSAFQARVAQGNDLYNPIFNNLGNRPLYDTVENPNGAYQAIDEDITSSYDRNLKKLNTTFSNAPTLNNAHLLQSQLGSAIRKLQTSDAKGNLTVADRSTMQGYQAAQEALKSDINGLLNKISPDLANQYNAASANWAMNVIPYLDNPKIAQIAKGDITNPNAITNLFKNPEPETQKIVEDMGDQAKNKILYSELGKTQSNLTPENLKKAFDKLDQKGLGSYVTPNLSQQMDVLSNRIRSRNFAQMGSGALVGGALGHSLEGALPFAEASGALLSGLGSPYAMRYLQQRLPLQQIAAALSKTGKTVYPPLKVAAVGNLINGV